MNPYRAPRLVVTPLMYATLGVVLLLVVLERADVFQWTFISWTGALLGFFALLALHIWLRQSDDRWQQKEDRALLGLEEAPSEKDREVLGTEEEVPSEDP